MKALIHRSIALLAAVLAFDQGNAQDRSQTIDVIIQSDNSTESAVNVVQSMGGTIRHRYRNVPAVSATVPAGSLKTLASSSGITRVEKDRLLYLTDTPNAAKNENRPKTFMRQTDAKVHVRALQSSARKSLPQGYAGFLYSGAAQTWDDTLAGEGSVVAVVDSGVVPNVALSEAVIGAPGFPDGYNAVGDGVSPTDPANYFHGTHVAGVIASSAVLSFDDPTDPLFVAISTYLPWTPDFVPIVGQAPAAKIYPVKVFPVDGGGTPTSVILDGLDHVLSLKKGGLLDIDVVNMSLGGPTLWDGRDTFDRFLTELTKAHIVVVCAAGNEGPTPNSVGSPATSFSAISAGALDFAPSSRVLYEYLGLVYGPDGVPFNGDETPGMGLVMRPHDEVRVANFSSRGPMSDGRSGPEISAYGQWTFFVGPQNELTWASGTSFSSPAVAGAAALLNAYWEHLGRETAPIILENVLLTGANPNLVGRKWRDVNDQGNGALDVPASLARLKCGNWLRVPNLPNDQHVLSANVLGKPAKGKTQSWRSGPLTVGPSEPFDAVFEISPWTSKVTIEVSDIQTPDNSGSAFWPNSLEVHVQSAKRTAAEHPIAVYWYPFFYGDSFTIDIEDGPWTFAGYPWVDQPMEPGLMKLSLLGDSSNESPVKFKTRIVRENLRQPPRNRIASGYLRMGDDNLIPVEIPAGLSQATFDLKWQRDWTQFPTSDIDMLIINPDFEVVSVDGATLNSPERAVIQSPGAGTWYVLVSGFEVYKTDFYELFLTKE